MSAGGGADVSVSMMTGIFLGGEYSFYPYDYLVAQTGFNLSVPEVSGGAFQNLVIGHYKGKDMSEMTPQSITGPFEYFGGGFAVGTPLLRLSLGIGGQLSRTTTWDIWEFGVTASAGVGPIITGGIKSNYPMRFMSEKDAGTGAWLLNRFVIPTAKRGTAQTLIAPFLSPGIR
jgi:hypothetical protein